jgi:hypothetical protein
VKSWLLASVTFRSCWQLWQADFDCLPDERHALDRFPSDCWPWALRHGTPSLINHYQHLELEKGQRFGPELVLRGSRDRVPAMLMTTLTTTLALLPFVFPGNLAGLEIVRPMAIIMMGGFVISTLLNLFALPALYLRYGSSRELDLDVLPVPGTDLQVVATD